MTVAVDTNILVRVATKDDPVQAQLAFALMARATLISVSTSCLCELVWVLRSVYHFQPAQMATAIRKLLSAPNVMADRPVAAAGLAVLEAGGDFADGVIAYEGRWLGGATFVSFDRKAVKLLQEQGFAAQLLGANA